MVKKAKSAPVTKSAPIGFSFDDGVEPTLFIPGFLTQLHGSAWVAHNGEDTIVVTMMGRQDFSMAWSVTVVEVDGKTMSECGFTKRGKEPVKKVNKVLRKLAKQFFPKTAKATEVNEDRLGYGVQS